MSILELASLLLRVSHRFSNSYCRYKLLYETTGLKTTGYSIYIKMYLLVKNILFYL